MIDCIIPVVTIPVVVLNSSLKMLEIDVSVGKVSPVVA